jgi:hypothetical protein
VVDARGDDPPGAWHREAVLEERLEDRERVARQRVEAEADGDGEVLGAVAVDVRHARLVVDRQVGHAELRGVRALRRAEERHDLLIGDADQLGIAVVGGVADEERACGPARVGGDAERLVGCMAHAVRAAYRVLGARRGSLDPADAQESALERRARRAAVRIVGTADVAILAARRLDDAVAALVAVDVAEIRARDEGEHRYALSEGAKRPSRRAH